MRWLTGSLNNKFAVGTASGLIISSLVFLVLYINLYSSELASERAEMARQINSLLQTSLENAMLKRDLDGLQQIVNSLGQQPHIHAVMITNPEGEVRFASDKQLLGRQEHSWIENGRADHPSTLFVKAADGRELLRNINPVHNRSACIECHGPVSKKPVNGILYVDYDASPIREKARNTTLLLMGSGALIVLLNIVGGWMVISRYVLKPVGKLSVASKELTAGKLETRTDLQGSDELSQLGQVFNQMAENLQNQMQELANQKAFLQGLVDAIPDGVRVIGMDYRILLVNQSYRRQLGIEDKKLVGSYCYESSHNTDHPCPPTLLTCPVNEISVGHGPVKSVHRHQRKDGSFLEVEIYAAPLEAVIDGQLKVFVVESIRDLSQQVKFSHEQKLAELGKLASGVAHEIHNPLASVRLALHGTKEHLDHDECNQQEIREYLQLVDREVDKCINVTERLLKLSAHPSGSIELVDLTTTVVETLSLLDWEAQGNDIEIEIDCPENLRILATDSEMRMVVLNLAQNAFHAMPEGGRMRISGSKKGTSVELRFEDNGVGILPKDADRIFDPFFSRRADGHKGTGLGLSITRTIVDNYKGHIAVESIPGEGSCFIVTLPDADEVEVADA